MAAALPPRHPHAAKTARGQRTREAILRAARQICASQWLDHLSLAELARGSGTTRASVLFQFPEGWAGVAAELMIEELGLWTAQFELRGRARRKPAEQIRAGLQYVLRRSEELGALLPNLRAFNFVWGETIEAEVRPATEALLERLAALLAAAARGDASRVDTRMAAQGLCFLTLDVACAPMFRRLQPAERDAVIDSLLDTTLKGLASA